ncbi:MAG: SGNH/GDSL hydrolase family protein [Chthoniobacterales bacterium]|nr:SGNH/GDSL hydrolase family protein [Chthoniobacterales bacterium]
MRDFTLGILGGCKTHQARVPKSKRYHELLKRRLAEAGCASLKVRIARNFEQEHVRRLESLIAEHALDAVMLDIRSVFVGKASLITISATPSEFRYYLHPYLFRPWRSGWAEVQNSDFAGCMMIGRRKNPGVRQLKDARISSDSSQASEPTDWADVVPGATRIAGVSIRDLFYLGGALCGLDAWAIRDELRMLSDMRIRCAELRLPLFVMGPSRRPDNFWLDRLCKKLDARLRTACSEWAVPYRDLMRVTNEKGARMYRPDGLHLTGEGHGYCADQLGEMCESWLEETRRDSRALSVVGAPGAAG